MTHKPSRLAYTNSGRPIENGILATTKQDFNSHHTGTDFRHGARDTDMELPLTSLNNAFYAPNVQETLEKIASYLECIGQGFVSIGDGYSTCAAGIVVGAPGVPDFETAFGLALASPKLANGGIVLLSAGTYKISDTITVPAGISVMGELSGTIVVAEADEKPMFQISRSINRPYINTDSTIKADEALDTTKFFNLTLIDNIEGKTTGSGNPDSMMKTVPMILCETGSTFTCEQVSFIGRLGPLGSSRTKTFRGIGYTTVGGETTTLNVKNCYFDGLKSAVDFPLVGSMHRFSIDGCRARVYGSDDAGFPEPQNNTFVSVAGGSVKVTNNFVYGAGLYVNSLVTATTTSTTLQVVIINNSGTIGANVTTGNLMNLSTTAGSVDAFPSFLSGNNWGNRGYHTNWFMTVGDGISSIGDITGGNALDLAIQLGGDLSADLTIILNPGTYTVTGNQVGGSNNSKLKLIGNKRGKTYPIVLVDISNMTTDDLGHKYFPLGSYAKSIDFRAQGAYQSVLFSDNASQGKTIEVDDCIFTNLTLLGEKLNGSGVTNFSIKNCQFSQSGAYADDVCILLPPANTVRLENCHFSGNGYVGGIGEYSGIGYTSSGAASISNVFLSNVVMDLTSKTITAATPLGADNTAYFDVDSANINMFIDHCEIVASVSFANVAPIGGGLNTTFKKFISFNGRELLVNNSTFNGPEQTFLDTGGGNTHPIPTLWVSATHKFSFDNSRVIGGGLPIQVSNALTSDVFKDGIYITNSELTKGIATGCVSRCLLDVDMDLASVGANSAIGKVAIKGCSFINHGSDTSYTPLHAVATTYYDILGCVNIYAQGFHVDFSNNNIYTLIEEDEDALFDSFAGLVVKTRDTENSSIGDALSVQTKICNNTITHSNNYESSTTTDIATGVYCESFSGVISGNSIFYSNSATAIAPPTSNFSGCLAVESRNSTTLGGSIIVTGNHFHRANTALKRGYVLLTTDCEAGAIVDNFFDYVSTDSGLTAQTMILIEDNSGVTHGWTKERNSNQMFVEEIRGSAGQHLFGSSFGLLMSTAPGANSTAFLSSETYPETANWTQVANTSAAYRWTIPLVSTIPRNVRVIEASVRVSYNQYAASSSAITLRIKSDLSGEEYISHTMSVGSSNSYTITLNDITVGTYDPFGNYTASGENLFLEVDGQLNAAAGGNLTVDIEPINIIYVYL